MRHRAPPFEPSYQFTPGASKNNAFAWASPLRPSIFTERNFMAFKDGKSASDIATDAVKKRERESGISPGSIYGISKASDKACEEFQRRSLEKKKARAPA